LRNVVTPRRKCLLKRSTFMPLRGTTFRMTGVGDDVDVTLAEVNDLLPRQAGDEHRFALVFLPPSGHAGSQGIYTFRHRDIGAVALFVAPVGRGVDRPRYEAVINRL